MIYRHYKPADASAIESLFISVFSDSESEADGLLIGNLVKKLMAETAEKDLFGFVGVDGERLAAAIFFSRFTHSGDACVFLLSPVSVDSKYQRQGIGQGLINYGLDALRNEGVEFAITYGDPAFYRKVGFRRISPEAVVPPLVLSQPEGWLGQSLAKDPIESLTGRFSCVPAFNDQVYW